MICAWKELVSILPRWLGEEVDKRSDDMLQEIRLRLNSPPELIMQNGSADVARQVTVDDLTHCINVASKYSPWAAATLSEGFLTVSGGHRIGVCGEAIMINGKMTGIRHIRSLCVRVARDYPGISKDLYQKKESILILGSPGSGKTTLLRDLIRKISDRGSASVSVVDERGELFPLCSGTSCFEPGKRTDILTGCDKASGIDIVLRTMGPDVIAVDEITAEHDCQAIIRAAWCGVRLLATAHAASMHELRSRTVYAPLLKSGIFRTVVVLDRDKSWGAERYVQ